MASMGERLAPREGYEERLVSDLNLPAEDVRDVLDGLESMGFAVVPDEWVPDAGALEVAAERMDEVRRQLTGNDQSRADTARTEMRRLTDLACAVLGLPDRSDR